MYGESAVIISLPVERNTVRGSDDITIALPKCTLAQQKGIWTLFFEGKGYMRFLDAKSRMEAEQQIAEMLVQSMEARLH
jgi:hypothetical protein